MEFYLIEGMDGTGKDTIVSKILESKKFFDLSEFMNKNQRFPSKQELSKYLKIINIIKINQPLYFGIGKIIRDYVVFNTKNYNPYDIANLYALDRLILYIEFFDKYEDILKDKTILMIRSFISNVIYQTNLGLNKDYIIKLHGNQKEISYFKKFLNSMIILTVNPYEGENRILKSRNNITDFEKTQFSLKLLKTINSNQMKDLLNTITKNYKIVDTTNKSIEEVFNEVNNVIKL